MGLYSFAFILFLLSSNVSSKHTRNQPIIKELQRYLAQALLQSTVKTTKCTVISVLPLQFSFCKLLSVAQGKAKEELLKALGFTNVQMANNFYAQFKEIILPLQQTDLLYVNKIYADYSKDINLTFAQNSSDQYGVHVERVSYSMPIAATRFINNGIASFTYRRVEDVLSPGEINNHTSLMLITAGHFKPSWENHFDPSLTRNRPFRTSNTTRTDVPMMAKVIECEYYDAGDYKVVTMKLGSQGASMTFVQPDFLTLRDVLDKFVKFPDSMKTVRQQMKWTPLKIVLPRMKVKNQVDLIDLLKKNGMRDIFNANSTGLNAILKDNVNTTNVFVSKVRQKLFVEMDEFGVSRVNADWYRPRTIDPPNIKEIVLDRPFYFTVNLEVSPTDSSVGETFELLNGVYYGPE